MPVFGSVHPARWFLRAGRPFTDCSVRSTRNSPSPFAFGSRDTLSSYTVVRGLPDGREVESEILLMNGLGADDADETIVVLLGALGEAGENERQIAGRLRQRVGCRQTIRAQARSSNPHAPGACLIRFELRVMPST